MNVLIVHQIEMSEFIVWLFGPGVDLLILGLNKRSDGLGSDLKVENGYVALKLHYNIFI
jgi:hypothetical protein